MGNGRSGGGTRFVCEQSGNVTLFGAAAIMVMAVIAGMAIDYSRHTHSKTELQAALDSAVLAAVIGETASRNATAQKYFDIAFDKQRKYVTKLEWTSNSDGSFSGRASLALPNMVMNALGIASAAISANATAIGSAGGGGSTDGNGKPCIMLVNPTATQALLINTPVTIQSPACRIDVHSTAAPAAIFNTGFSHDLKKICVKGTNVIQNAGAVPALETGCMPLADPYAGKLPVVAASGCTVKDQTYAGVNALVPGTYCGTFNFNASGTLNLSPGLYVFKDAHWNLNKGWTVNGSDVTFYFADSNSYVQVNSGVAMHVTAPTSGTYKDILMYEPAGLDRSAFTINGSAGHSFRGLFYLPSRDITFNSVSSIRSEQIAMVFGTLILDDIDWKFEDAGYVPAGSGAAGSAQTVRLTK